MKIIINIMLRVTIIILFLSILILPGCGVFVITRRTEADFNYYVKKFERLYKKKVKSRITFYSLHGTIVGVCNFLTKQIVIDPEKWMKYDYFTREELIFHELGHCELYRFHNEKKLKDKCPYSIMHPEVIDSSCYKLHREHYHEELFKK